MPTEMNGLTLGSVVLKLLAAMKAEKQAGGKAAIASRYMKTDRPWSCCPTASVIRAVVCSTAVDRQVAPTGARDDQQRQTAGEDRGQRRSRPGRPVCTSFASRLFMPKSGRPPRPWRRTRRRRSSIAKMPQLARSSACYGVSGRLLGCPSAVDTHRPDRPRSTFSASKLPRPPDGRRRTRSQR